MWRKISACVGLLAIACADEVGSVEGALTTALAREGEVVLDVRSDGAALFGRVEEAPEGSDGDRVLVLRGEHDGAPFAGALEGARVLDARFIDGGLVTVGADHVLRFHAANAVSELDARVEAPISVVGSAVAYARGEMPDFEIARADVRTGAITAITQGMAPAWSPALSPDAREVIFVSSAAGSPRLYRTDGATSRALAPTERFPTAPRAPRWEGDSLSFEDELGAARLTLSTGSLMPIGGGTVTR